MVNEDKEKKVENSADTNRDISQFKKNIEEKTKATSFLKDAIASLKDFIVGKKNKESSIDHKESQKNQAERKLQGSPDLSQDLLSLKESALVSTEIASTKEHLDDIKASVVKKIKKPLYQPQFPSSKQFVQYSDRGDVSQYIAQSADDLQLEINKSNSKILQYFYS